MTHPALATMVEAALLSEEAITSAAELYAEGGCMGLAAYERREATQSIIESAVSSASPTLLSLAEYVRGLEEYAQAASEALLKVRPLGGSELFTRVGEQYLADPAYCGNEITSIRERLHSAKLATALSGGKP